MMKILLGVMSTIVGTITVSVPVVLNSGLRSRVKRDIDRDSSDLGGGDIVQTSLSKCGESASSDLKSVEFGKQKVINVCGKSELTEDLSNFGDYGNLFWKEGQGSQLWNQEKGKNQGSINCSDGENELQGSIMSRSNGGAEYLGFCKDSDSKHTKFVKKIKTVSIEDVGEKTKFGICSKDCGEEDSSVMSMSALVLEKEKPNNGKEVQFYER